MVLYVGPWVQNLVKFFQLFAYFHLFIYSFIWSVLDSINYFIFIFLYINVSISFVTKRFNLKDVYFVKKAMAYE